MLFLKFRIGADAFMLEAAQIAEVLPLLHLTPIPQAPASVAGLLNYRGRPVPVITWPGCTSVVQERSVV